MKNKLFIIMVFTITSICLLFSSSGFARSASTLKDVHMNHWAYDAIVQMTDAHTIPVKKDGLFYPSQQITRAEAAQYIYNTLNTDKKRTDIQFEDVPQHVEYADAVYTLTNLGVIHPAKKFNPNATLTRSQLCKMIAIAFGVEVDELNNTHFQDVPPAHWAKHYIETLADIHIMKGTGRNSFSPESTVTRAEMAIILKRMSSFQHKIASNELIYDFLQKHYIATTNDYPRWTEEVIALINEERQKQGLSLLQKDEKLNQLAVIKGNDMVHRKYFEHYSPFYGYPWDMAGIFDYRFTSFGENIAKNFPTPESVVHAWMGSPSHRANVLNSNYTYIGVACTKGDDGQLYWVQHFSSK